MNPLLKLIGPAQPVPQPYRSNFLHLYLDIAWFGILNSSTIAFLAVYATRLGATTQQIGFINASPAIINLILTMPVGIWVQRFSVYKITPRAAAVTRFFYLLLVPLPWLFPPDVQIWVIIILVLVMNIPGTINAVIGNAFLAEAVPPEWRGYVVGIRNALLAAVSVITSLIVGVILQKMPFYPGYQVVFFLGFLGAAMSNLHLFLIRPVGQVGESNPVSSRESGRHPYTIRLDIWRGKFGRILWLLFYYQLAMIIAAPIFPIYQVRVLNQTDETISMGVSVFWLIYFIGSTQTSRLSGKYGYRMLLAIGTLLTGVTILIFSVSYQIPVYLVCQLVSGTGWALIGGGLLNYLLENVPADDRPAYLSWYNLLINGAILAGSFLGPWIAGNVGLYQALLLTAGFRVLAGVLFLKWG